MSTHPDLKFNTPTWQPERDPEYNLLVAPDQVARGGSWYNPAGYARAAGRIRDYPGYRGGGLGLRLVRDSMAPGVAK